MDKARFASFRQMKDGTQEDYEMLEEFEHEFIRALPGRIMDAMRGLEKSLSGYRVSRLEHTLIGATMAERDRADTDWIVATLVHDIGDALAPCNHDGLAAVVVAPYLREECTWTLKTHGIFQMVYYGHHLGKDRYARDRFKDHPYYETGVEFCERWDQSAFDPDFKYQPLEHFEPLVQEVFTRPAWDPKFIRKGERVPLVGSGA